MREPKPLLELQDVAREAGISYSGARVAVDSGRLVPAYRTRRGVRLFTARDVRAFIAARKVQGRDAA